MLRGVSEDRLYFRQLLAGRDVAAGDPLARQMLNFVYLVGDRETGEALAVDPAYAPGEVLDLLAADGMRLSGVLVTHYHPDHVGGDLMGFPIEGLAQLLERADVPVHVHKEEASLVSLVTGVTDALVGHDSGDTVSAGHLPVELLHTPGHTPGSQCFLVSKRLPGGRGVSPMLIAGDTLFLEGCGRTDLPGGDPEAMYFSLTQRLAKVPDSVALFPGHLYAPDPSATLGEVRRRNYVFRPSGLQDWLALFGG
jgi:glyoxylase-like metal-dependent hydrolase (beta-lactamase superfamily II)